MNDVAIKPRYSRSIAPNRKKKKSARNSASSFPNNILRKILIAGIIVGLFFTLESINTPVTKGIADKAGTILNQDINVNNIYNWFNGFFNKKLNTDFNDTNTDGQYQDTSNLKEDTEASAYAVSENFSEYKFVIPVNGTISSAFGSRIHPTTKTEGFHKGVDIEVNIGATIVAALEGEVIEKGNEPAYGLYIKLKHSSGFETVYAHCSSISSIEGQKVKQGEAIAKVGDTGIATGTHLHFEIWKDGKVQNPQNFLKIRV